MSDDQRAVSGDPTQRISGADVGEPPSSGVVNPSPPEAASPHFLGELAKVFGENARFVEREMVGHGGMGSVVRAYDKDLLRDVAIKVLGHGREPAARADVEHFLEEARITGQLEHPNIVPVYEFGQNPRGAYFLCMKLVQGETLEQAIGRAGPSRLQPDRLADFLQVFVKVCEAVSFAHSRGVVHRDLKPSNIMIGDFGQVYVMDWGIACLIPVPPGARKRVDLGYGENVSHESDLPGAPIGTVSYMAPEQAMGLHDRVDERTDVFALGATLYEIITGQPPLGPDSVRSLWMSKGPVAIPHPDQVVSGAAVPAELARITMKALAYIPADRYPSVDALKSDIERFLRGAWHLPRVLFPAGSLVIAQGEPGDSAYIIVEGRCSVFRSGEGGAEVEIRQMGPGEVFGETAVFSEKPRSASVRAITDVTAMVVTSRILTSALGLNSWMGTFVKALAERFREVDQRLRELEGERRDTPAK